MMITRGAHDPLTAPTSRSPQAGSFLLLDACRGLAALWVLTFHASGVATRHHPELHSFGVYRASSVGYLGVQMFFVISGYCIANAAWSALRPGRSIGSFVKARVRRIYPPMWLSLPLFFAFAVLGRVLVANGFWTATVTAEHDPLDGSWKYWLANLTLAHPLLQQPLLSGVCWTLSYEMAFYLIVASALFVGRRFQRPRLLLNSLHALTLLVTALLAFAPNHVCYPWDMWPQFGLGVLLFDLLSSGPRTIAAAWAVLIALAWAAFLSLQHVEIGVMRQPGRLTCGFCLGFAVLLLCLHHFDARLSSTALVRPLRALGVISYSLYLTHLFTVSLTNQVFKAAHLTGAVNLRFVASIAASVAFAWLFFRVAERPFIGGAARARPLGLSSRSIPTGSAAIELAPVAAT